MTLPEIVIWAVVLAVGWSFYKGGNLTAGALLLAWLSAQVVWLITGDNLPVEFYLYPDSFVLAVIVAKDKRSVADWIIAAIFPVMWFFYVVEIHDFYRWWALWTLVIVQLFAAGVDSLLMWLRERSMPSSVSKSDLGGPTDSDRFIEIPVKAQVCQLAADVDGSKPFLAPDNPRDTRHPAGVVAMQLRVSPVGLMGAITQVRDAVVRLVAVDVVDFLFGPRAIVQHPSKAVSQELLIENGDCAIAEGSGAAGFPTNELSVPRSPNPVVFKEAAVSVQPKESPSLRLISEKLTKCFRGGYFSGSHCAVLSHEGQGRAVSQAPFRPAFSSTVPPTTQRRGGAHSIASGGEGHG